MPATPTPFTIDIPEGTIADLRDRLRRTRWTDAVAPGWDYGIDLGELRGLMTYWAEEFDWRTRQAELNERPHRFVEIEGHRIHFIHQPGEGVRRVPLLLLHGWPGSFIQMLNILPLLTAEIDGFAFDVVAGSLPGFGFSGRPAGPGMSVRRMGELFHALMADVLGYERYALRAGDLGAGVLSSIALAHPEAVIGTHSGGTNPWVQQVPDDLSPEEQTFVENAQRWNQQEMAYATLHATKPQTLAVGLNDSPAGMAAWILEKFRAWSDCDGVLANRFTPEELLTNLTIYWVTETIGSSIRLYYETMRDQGGWGRPDVPAALLMSPKDMFPTPREWAARWGRIDRWTEIDRGGHFLEWEEPELVADDLRAFFGSLA